jgi:hypothetical protein
MIVLATTMFSVVIVIYLFLFESFWRHLDSIETIIRGLEAQWNEEKYKFAKAGTKGYYSKYSMFFSLLIIINIFLITSIFSSIYTLYIAKTRLTETLSLGLVMSATIILLSTLVIHHGRAGPANLFKELEKYLETMKKRKTATEKTSQA